MRIIKTFFKTIKRNPKALFRIVGNKGCFNWMPDKMYLKIIYYCEIGKKLNLKTPNTFNEKLQWIKLFDRKPEYSKYVDKYYVREFISESIGENYLVPIIGVFNSIDEIKWGLLPEKFVLKCTHGSHCNIICTDKYSLNINEAEKKLKKWLKKTWYWFGREWPYKYVKPRIICEEYLGDLSGVPNDYKIMCFNGKPQVIQVHKKENNGKHFIDFYNLDGELLPLRKKGFLNSGEKQIRIENLREMLNLATKLSVGTRYLRTDFYLVNGKIYFGELTFFDSSGFIDFEPQESNVFLGEMINLGI